MSLKQLQDIEEITALQWTGAEQEWFERFPRSETYLNMLSCEHVDITQQTDYCKC